MSEPTEEQIKKAMDRAGNDPRKLAIAYMRTLKRERDLALVKGVQDKMLKMYELLSGAAPK